jgi:4-hydroxythreonine-4-phosphate dehydrogenase
MKPILAITMGDINGVGPEILVQASTHPAFFEEAVPIVIGSTSVYESVRASCGKGLPSRSINHPDEARTVTDALPFWEPADTAIEWTPGTLSAEAGKQAMDWLDIAIGLTAKNAVQGIVTCPINKEGIHMAGYTCRGHTDYIAEKTHTESYRMCLFTPTLRVIHVSDHVPLRQAIEDLSPDSIIESVNIAHDALLRLQTPTKHIAVAGLNPHAGEAGAFGREEIDIIIPAIEACAKQGILCSGPHSPDTLFNRAFDGEFDAVICLYHDQGHIPMKLVAMDEGVNVTLGLPIVRTSVDHGTAYDIAGQHIAREDSLLAAAKMAAQLSRSI